MIIQQSVFSSLLCIGIIIDGETQDENTNMNILLTKLNEPTN